MDGINVSPSLPSFHCRIVIKKPEMYAFIHLIVHDVLYYEKAISQDLSHSALL